MCRHFRALFHTAFSHLANIASARGLHMKAISGLLLMVLNLVAFVCRAVATCMLGRPAACTETNAAGGWVWCASDASVAGTLVRCAKCWAAEHIPNVKQAYAQRQEAYLMPQAWRRCAAAAACRKKEERMCGFWQMVASHA